MGMMSTLRNRMHVVLWSLLILFLLSMTVGGLVGGANIIDQLLGRVNPSEAIGSINGSKITPDQFNQAVSIRLESLRNTGIEISDQQLTNIREEVWNSFVEERLTEQAIVDLNIHRVIETSIINYSSLIKPDIHPREASQFILQERLIILNGDHWMPSFGNGVSKINALCENIYEI